MPPLAIKVCWLLGAFFVDSCLLSEFQGVTYTLGIKRARLVDS
jgi:hypothetical protein